MSDQNSTQFDQIRPEDLMQELGIKKDTYYADLSYLDIKAVKDKNGKVYLTNAQANLVRQLRSYVMEVGRRDGFTPRPIDEAGGDLVHHENSHEMTTFQENHDDIDLEIPSSETAELEDNLEQLVYEAAQIKMQNLATPHLVKLHLAQQMSEDDLPPEMQEKVQQVRHAANPKFQPSSVASNLLQQWRNRGGNS